MVSEDALRNELHVGQGQVTELNTELRDVVQSVE